MTATATAPVWPDLMPPSAMKNSEMKSGRGRQACENREGSSNEATDACIGTRDPAGRMRCGRGLDAEERNCRREPDGLRDCVTRDVHDDTDQRKRVSEADSERDDAHVLEAGIGQESLPRQRAPEERHGDRKRGEAEEHEDLARGMRTDGPRERLCTRQATSRTDGKSAAERRAETGGGASECASGSQL